MCVQLVRGHGHGHGHAIARGRGGPRTSASASLSLSTLSPVVSLRAIPIRTGSASIEQARFSLTSRAPEERARARASSAQLEGVERGGAWGAWKIALGAEGKGAGLIGNRTGEEARKAGRRCKVPHSVGRVGFGSALRLLVGLQWGGRTLRWSVPISPRRYPWAVA